MRPTLTDEVQSCNRGRTHELAARRSTPARSANHELEEAVCARGTCLAKHGACRVTAKAPLGKHAEAPNDNRASHVLTLGSDMAGCALYFFEVTSKR
jgi:hypothetical protein